MKKTDLLIVAAAGLGLWWLTRAKMQPSGAARTAQVLNTGGQVNVPNPVKAIFNTALPGQDAWGWQYFNNGTVIGPDGSYYLNGQKVWSPT